MASLRNHKVIEVWKVVNSDKRYHITATNLVVVTFGPRCGRAKVLRVTTDGVYNTVGIGQCVEATEYMPLVARYSVEHEK